MQRFALPLAVIAALSTSLTHADVTTTGDVSPDPTTILPAQNLTIGDTAPGTLLIDTNTAVNSQTTVTNAIGIIANQDGSTGTVTVTGGGAIWTNSGSLFVGRSGNGILNIEAGGAVSNTDASISFGSTNITGPLGSGSVTVTGTNSTWTTDRLTVGASATGALNIKNGGTVSSAKRVRIGENFNSTGTATVTGPNSNWNIINRNLTVGFGGTGTLNIDNGGTVSNRVGYLGSNNEDVGNGSGFGVGTTTVTGANSKWTNTGLLNTTTGVRSGLFVGGNDDAAGISGTLNIFNSGTVEAMGATKIWEPGTVNLNGGTLTTESLDILGQFNFTQGTLNLTNSSVTIGASAGIPGFFESTLSLQPGMAVNVTNGTGNVTADGILSIAPTAAFSAHDGTNDGQISVTNGSLAYTDAFTNNASGELTLVSATATFAGDGIPTSSGGNNADGLTNLGTLNLINATVNGDVHLPSESIINVAGAVTFQNGLVSGGANFSGTNNLITFNGGFSPGDSPSEVQITGDVSLGSSATLFLELAGTTLGSEYDHLDINGLLTADGTLDIKLLNSFDPQLGDTFDLLDFNSLTGSFSSILLPTLNSGLTFDTTSLLTTGTVSVVPEPMTAMLLSFLGLAALRRRRLG